MAKTYEVNDSTRRIARLMSWMARLGIGKTQILTTNGRKSGAPREVPVSPIELDGVDYVVSPYGARSWVLNVRADPLVTLRHGSKVREAKLEEVTGPTSAPIVAAYHARESYARQYMDVPENPSQDDFAARFERFPVFAVRAR